MTDSSGMKNDSGVMGSLLVANDLTYEMSRSLTLCVERNYTKEPFNIGSAGIYGPNDVAERVFSTGDRYVHGDKSYLCLNVQITSSTATAFDAAVTDVNYCSFGPSGSVLNLFKTIELRSKDSQIIERVEMADIYNNMRAFYTHSSDWMDNMGSVIGFYPQSTRLDETLVDSVIGNFSAQTTGLKEGRQYAVPLNLLLGFFKYPKLIPSFLMTGATLHITFNDAVSAFDRHGDYLTAPDFSYEVTNMYCRMATCALTDAAQSRLANLASTKGLKILFETIYHQSQSSNTNKVNISLRSNIAQALSVVVKTRYADSTNGVVNKADKDANQSDIYSIKRFHFRHGSTRYPSDDITDVGDAYMITQGSFDKVREVGLDNSVDYYEYKGSNVPTALKTCKNVVAYSFEKSQNMDTLSGVSLSNARVLSWEAEFVDDRVRIHDMYLEYSTLVTAFTSNCTVET